MPQKKFIPRINERHSTRLFAEIYLKSVNRFITDFVWLCSRKALFSLIIKQHRGLLTDLGLPSLYQTTLSSWRKEMKNGIWLTDLIIHELSIHLWSSQVDWFVKTVLPIWEEYTSVYPKHIQNRFYSIGVKVILYMFGVIPAHRWSLHFQAHRQFPPSCL